MRGLATLAVTLLILAPSASAAGLLYERTSDAVDITVAIVQPAVSPVLSTTRPAIVEDLPAVPLRTSVDRPAAPAPAPIEHDAVVELPDEVPVAPNVIAVHVVNSKPQFDPRGMKAERIETQAALARAPVELPAARLPMSLAPSTLALTQPAQITIPEAPEREPTSPQPQREAPTKTPPVVPESRDAPWPAVAAIAGLAIAILAPFLLYHRLRGARSLESETRAKILEMLKATPGLAPAHVARELGVDPTTALYHLRFLVREGLALAEGPRRGARYFAAGSVSAEDRARIIAVEGARDVLDVIVREPGTPKSALAGKLAIARATLSWHLGRLERAGLVRYERAGRNVLVYPKESLSAQPSA